MLSDAFLRRLDALSLRMAKPASGGSGGLRRSKALGSSVEFSDFREYAPGDDLRRVDWNAYARFDRLFLKLFMEEQEQRVHLVVDASGSMAFGQPQKWSCGVMLAEALCYMALCGSDSVVLCALTGEGQRHTRPLQGRHCYPEAVAFLAGLTPGGSASLTQAAPALPLSAGRGMTVVLSDLLFEDGWQRGLEALWYRKQEVSVLQLWSREEWEPTLEEAAELCDSETGQKLALDLGYDLLRRYRETARGYVEQVQGYCRAHGMGHALLVPQEDFEAEMLRDLSRAGLLGT